MIRWFPLALPLAALIGTGLWGIDFGFHWDEAQLGLAVDTAVLDGRLLPGFYNYPTMAYWLTFASLAPDLLAAAFADQGLPLGQALHVALASEAHQLQVRALFLCVSSMAVVWVYLCVLRWRGSWPEALVAAALLAGSWQVGYHLRWIAPDGLLMQFGAATLACSVLAVQGQGNRRWAFGAAIAAGLGCGSKYPGALLLLVPLTAEWVRGRRSDTPERFWRAAVPLCLLFAAAYLVSTPGTLLEARTFLRDVTWELQHYRTGHGAYTVAPGPVHLGRALFYLSLVLFSPSKLVAGALFAAAALGAVVALRARDGHAAILLIFPAVYLLYMCSQRVMIVRNLLVLAPFLAVLGARGLATLAAAVPRRPRLALAAAVGAVLFSHALFGAWAAGTIRDRGSRRFVDQAAQYVQAHPGTTLYVTPRVREELETAAGGVLPTLTTDPGAEVDRVLLYHSETVPLGEYPANLPDFTTRWFGPYEIDPVYYSTWFGDDRLMLLSARRAQQLRIPRVLYE